MQVQIGRRYFINYLRIKIFNLPSKQQTERESREFRDPVKEGCSIRTLQYTRAYEGAGEEKSFKKRYLPLHVPRKN